MEPLTKQDTACQDPALFALWAVRDARVNIGDNVCTSVLGAMGLLVVPLLKQRWCLKIIWFLRRVPWESLTHLLELFETWSPAICSADTGSAVARGLSV